jgi:hypothetical protein
MVKNAIDPGVLTHDDTALLAWLGALLLVGLLEMMAGAVRHLYSIRNRARSDARVRDAIFAHALWLDASYHDRVGTSELMSRSSRSRGRRSRWGLTLRVRPQPFALVVVRVNYSVAFAACDQPAVCRPSRAEGDHET